MLDPRIRQWQGKNVFLGTSSWKYPGWKGLVYNRGYRSDKEFNETCLEEYAENFTAVGVDHTYYTWPTEKAFEKYVQQTPPGFKFGLKATEAVTIFQYPNIKRYGKHAGTKNETFLDAGSFHANFLTPLERFKDRIGPVMLEFSQFYPGTIASGSEFTDRLDKFFTALGPDTGFQFAVELRNANWLKAPYFEMLARHRAAHVFNAWTRMPTLADQLEAARDFELPAVVSRILLAVGTKYAEAVEAFEPYDKILEEHAILRKGGAALIRTAVDRGIPAYVFVNNRAEGCAPRTIQAILDEVEAK